ncbi:MAG: efflux RND transporter periplasmic adaptor subunit [Saprospiraceae bacterium]|nr:efflux RND transporter periplasmic adaptor subunit [Saprospiraceae bacterium]
MNQRCLAKIYLFILAFVIFACKEQQSESQVLSSVSQVQSEPLPVKIVPISRSNFPLRVLTNGTLRATQKVEIKLQNSGAIIRLPIQTGQILKQGDLIAQLDDRALRLQLQQAHLALEEAEVRKADLLIANGGVAYRDSSVGKEKLQLINTASGYNKALHAISQAEYELSKTTVIAPYSGVVAEMKLSENQQCSAGETICTLLSTDNFEAIFTLLEQDALAIKVGQTVKVQPTAMPNMILNAKISAINPIVSEQGLVTLHARLLAPFPKQLFEGMNLQIIIEQEIANQLIVPRTAVVLRSGKAVVFSYAAVEKVAKWNYVTIAHENDTHIAIAEGLQNDAIIIYEGNLNLDHDAAVHVTTN